MRENGYTTLTDISSGFSGISMEFSGVKAHPEEKTGSYQEA